MGDVAMVPAFAASWRLATSACAALLQQLLGLAAHIGGFACWLTAGVQ
jgi:hypothetical protein